MRDFLITTKPTSLTSLLTFLRDDKGATLTVSQDCLKTINKSHECLQLVLETETPLYGVNTGFGDSLFRFIPNNHAEKLQQNLISYLICGVGKPFPKSVARAVMVTRLLSLTRGYSGVSQSLVEHLAESYKPQLDSSYPSTRFPWSERRLNSTCLSWPTYSGQRNGRHSRGNF